MAKEEIISLEDTIKDLEKKYGEGVVLKQEHQNASVESISTGCYAIDNLLGCGGLPVGRVIEIYGMESSGKSSLCLFFAGQFQKQGKKIVYLDVEQAYDQRYAESLGVSTKDLIVSQPSTLEETFDIVRAFLSTKKVDMIVIDSLAAMIPKQDLVEGNLEKDSVAIKARLMSKYLPVISSESAKSKTIVLFINQLRSNIGVYYGPKDTTPGGKALKFFSSVRLSVSKGLAIKDKEVQIGNSMKVVAKKNKVGFPYKEAEVDIYYGEGVDLINDVIVTALEYEVLTKSGHSYLFGEVKLGVGKEQAKAFLTKNPAVVKDIKKEIDKKIKVASKK
jgi:recombination protein RecA